VTAIRITVPTTVIALFLVAVAIAAWAFLYFVVWKPLVRKYVSPWLWHRLGGKGEPPDDLPDIW
jgi:hypothetical protein